ncbi:glutamine amidotransferase [Aquiflexum balticum DSM 16537]|uniref:Imidazole glycerol phosphate synthase subunit HisH n=1 Tax=Aquiflexum balticum DSM 16537 TaxID=758820 RepID=A0A1W2H524_9BACT|nr:imidazole glycerol phosphate synthase subunit HisH [Aquiflexum balticum]SMD44067.1 glutamine amidotransferase [Aquiflexum balticum DSM 16537]
MISIIDYGMGNLRSVQKACENLNKRAEIVSSPLELKKFDFIILPGVGHFGNAMEKIERKGWDKSIIDAVLGDKKKILGICLGMQLLTNSSEESNGIKGLGLLNAETCKFPISSFKIPHIGWNTIDFKKKSLLDSGFHKNEMYYFVHSYYVKCKIPTDVLCESTYGIAFDSAFESNNIVGFQFHPEKSHRSGLNLLNNFLSQK